MKNTTMIKPRTKKISILVAVFVLLVGVLLGGYLVLKSHGGSASQLAAILNGKEISSCQPNPNDQNADADNDGLKDWQEIQIYHTDPCKADTDGDGYLDGEETASGYDPLVKAPNDKLFDNSTAPRPEPTTLTGQFIAKFVEKFGGEPPDLASMSNPDLLNSQTNSLVAGAIDTFVKEHKDELNFIVSISEQEIKIAAAENEKTIALYFFNFQDSFKQNLVKLDEQYVLASFNAAKNGIETEDFSELDKYIQAEQKTFQKIKDTETPASFKELQLQSLSWLASYGNILEAAKLQKTDPLKALAAFQQWPQLQKNREGLVKMLLDIIKSFQDKINASQVK